MTNTKLRIAIRLRWEGRKYTQNSALSPGVEHHGWEHCRTETDPRHLWWRNIPRVREPHPKHQTQSDPATHLTTDLREMLRTKRRPRGCNQRNPAYMQTTWLLQCKDGKGEKDKGGLHRWKKRKIHFKQPHCVGLPWIQSQDELWEKKLGHVWGSWKFEHWVWY